MPDKRTCIFEDESEQMTFFKNYSQINCLFECRLQIAKVNLNNKSARKCSPWFFPFGVENEFLCDPYKAYDIIQNMRNISDEERCSHCLPGLKDKMLINLSLLKVCT